jgi:BolA protein
MKRNHKRTGLSMTAQDSTTTKQRMLAILTASFAPTVLDVLDESENHRGHGGFREGGETHFRVRIVSSAFKGKSRVDIHRMINLVLADELASGVHALAIEAKSD